MEVKTYLAQIRKCEAMIQNRRDTIQQLHDEALRITPTPIDGMKVNTTSSPDRRESLICDYLRMEQELEDEVRHYHAIRRDAIQLFEQLPLAQYDILYQVNILGRTLQDVATNADRSYSWATTTQNRAFKALQKLLDERDQA